MVKRILKKISSRLVKIGRGLRSRWKLLAILAVVVVAAGFFLYQRQQSSQPNLTFIKPEYTTLTKTLEVSGVVDAKEKAALRFAAGGKIVYLGAKEGDWVRKGQTIASIDQRELQKRLQQDLNAYVRERWDWESTQDATDYDVEDLETRRDIDQQQTQLHDTVLDVEIRNIAITNAYLNAPFAGVLVASPVTVPGVHVTGGEAFEIINPSTLVFKAAVDEADIGLVKLGQTGDINLDAYNDQPISATVSAISYRSQQASSGTVFVIDLPLVGENLVNRYRLGMNGDVVLNIETKENVLAIPLDATRTREGKTYVDVRTGETTFEEREIQVGLETDDMIEVISGLNADQEIVLPES